MCLRPEGPHPRTDSKRRGPSRIDSGSVVCSPSRSQSLINQGACPHGTSFEAPLSRIAADRQSPQKMSCPIPPKKEGLEAASSFETPKCPRRFVSPACTASVSRSGFEQATPSSAADFKALLHRRVRCVQLRGRCCTPVTSMGLIPRLPCTAGRIRAALRGAPRVNFCLRTFRRRLICGVRTHSHEECALRRSDFATPLSHRHFTRKS